jgi:Mg2+ and Co2+ transporter CorA
MSWLSDFFGTPEPTIEDACRKAERAGWQVEESDGWYAVHGTGYDDNDQEVDKTWHFPAERVDNMNYLLDHAISCQIGDEYRRQKFGLEPDEIDTSPDWYEHKQEIREHRLQYYDEEYKPGWKRFLGL